MPDRKDFLGRLPRLVGLLRLRRGDAFVRTIDALHLAATASDRVHQVHDRANSVIVDRVLELLHLRHLVKHLADVLAFLDVHEDVQMLELLLLLPVLLSLLVHAATALLLR